MGGAIGVGVDATWDVDGDSFPRPPQEEAADARWHRRADRPGGDIEPHFAASRAASATSMERTSSPFRRKAAARLPRKDFNPLQIPTLETDKANYWSPAFASRARGMPGSRKKHYRYRGPTAHCSPKCLTVE